MQSTIKGLLAAKALVKTDKRKALLDAIDSLNNPFLPRVYQKPLFDILVACDSEARRIDRALAYLRVPAR